MTPKIYNYVKDFTTNNAWYYNPVTNQIVNGTQTPSTSFSGFRMSVTAARQRNFIRFRGNVITAGNYYLKYNNGSSVLTVSSTINYDSANDETVIYFDRPSGASGTVYVIFSLSNSQVGGSAETYISDNFISYKAGSIGWSNTSLYISSSNSWNIDRIEKMTGGSWTP